MIGVVMVKMVMEMEMDLGHDSLGFVFDGVCDAFQAIIGWIEIESSQRDFGVDVHRVDASFGEFAKKSFLVVLG